MKTNNITVKSLQFDSLATQTLFRMLVLVKCAIFYDGHDFFTRFLMVEKTKFLQSVPVDKNGVPMTNGTHVFDMVDRKISYRGFDLNLELGIKFCDVVRGSGFNRGEILSPVSVKGLSKQVNNLNRIANAVQNCHRNPSTYLEVVDAFYNMPKQWQNIYNNALATSTSTEDENGDVILENHLLSIWKK